MYFCLMNHLLLYRYFDEEIFLCYCCDKFINGCFVDKFHYSETFDASGIAMLFNRA